MRVLKVTNKAFSFQISAFCCQLWRTLSDFCHVCISQFKSFREKFLLRRFLEKLTKHFWKSHLFCSHSDGFERFLTLYLYSKFECFSECKFLETTFMLLFNRQFLQFFQKRNEIFNISEIEVKLWFRYTKS
jgi:hypothetical protein